MPSSNYAIFLSNPVPLPDLHFDSFSHPVASIVFGGMAIVSLFPSPRLLSYPRGNLEKERYSGTMDRQIK